MRTLRARWGILVAGLALLACVSCATPGEITPGPGAEITPGVGQGAVAEEEGVSLEVRANAWQFDPRGLSEVVTPLLVRIRNQSGHPIAVRYRNFQLRTPDGEVLLALPPFNMRGAVRQRVSSLAYPYQDFEVYGDLAPYYPGIRSLSEPFEVGFDSNYYYDYYPELVRVELPTEEMVARALPEGVLQPGGVIEGFLYLQDVSGRSGEMDFVYDLVNARSGQQLGAIRIPFEAAG